MAKKIPTFYYIPRYEGNNSLTFNMNHFNETILSWDLTVSEIGYIFKLSSMAKNQYNSLIANDGIIHNLQTISDELEMNYSRCSQLIKRLDRANICKKLVIDGCNLFVLNPHIVHNNQSIDAIIYNKFTDGRVEMCDTPRRSKKINKINTETIGDNIYLLEHTVDNEISFYKIGYSKNIQERLKAYLIHNPSIKVIKTWKVEHPKNYEHEIHSNFEPVYNKEWYSRETLEKICTHLNLNIEL